MAFGTMTLKLAKFPLKEPWRLPLRPRLCSLYKFEKVTMKKNLLQIWAFALPLVVTTASLAKLPALSDEAKAKAAEAAAKTAWSGKVDGFLLCKAQDKVAAKFKTVKVADKDAKPAPKALPKDTKTSVTASTCTDPGPFVYTPAAMPTAAVALTPAAVPAKKP
jgi:hypothetical protein